MLLSGKNHVNGTQKRCSRLVSLREKTTCKWIRYFFYQTTRSSLMLFTILLSTLWTTLKSKFKESSQYWNNVKMNHQSCFGSIRSNIGKKKKNLYNATLSTQHWPLVPVESGPSYIYGIQRWEKHTIPRALRTFGTMTFLLPN